MFVALMPRKFFSWSQRDDGVSSKKKIGSNRNKQNKICFGVFWFVSWNQNSVCFGLLWCFEFISKQTKQTELFRNKLKQTETTLNFQKKIPKDALSQTVSVALLFVMVQSKHQNSLFRYRSETTETNVLFQIVPKLVSVQVSVALNWNYSFEGHPMGEVACVSFTVFILSGIQYNYPEAECNYTYRARIFKQSMGARNRVGIGLSFQPTRLHRLA